MNGDRVFGVEVTRSRQSRRLPAPHFHLTGHNLWTVNCRLSTDYGMPAELEVAGREIGTPSSARTAMGRPLVVAGRNSQF